MNWLENKIDGAINWIATKTADLTAAGVTVLISKIGMLIVSCEGIFIIIALVGIYFTLSGNRKLGTKLSSASILIYLLGVFLSHVN